jgi:hypothetical protein
MSFKTRLKVAQYQLKHFMEVPYTWKRFSAKKFSLVSCSVLYLSDIGQTLLKHKITFFSMYESII